MEELKTQILKCIDLSYSEIKKIRRGEQCEATEEQILAIIVPELQELLELLNNHKVPKKSDRYLVSFANAFTAWGWNMQTPSELFVLLTKINNEYEELLQV